MIKEIYTRSENDPYYDPTILEHNSDIESILSQIRMILGTTNGQVLGDFNFGTGIRDLVFTPRFNKQYIENKINEQINRYIGLTNYNISVSVSFYKQPNGEDAGLIDIYLNKVKLQGFIID